ncbi:branched-subunit amino acid aminotransferase/4-amino-4-deoxychorismate lyase [Pontibacter aydingkolensis]|uniref:branched-chain-amino-acid transaminase n=1 Tax=Pontibacter aydingkolensis TaxID=1911536 RepID=A0ABS7CWJ4_9BACT|nr:aminotransferase class IV [Pontibacter aydingkolensis]MBW7468150.1 aminotransferase class IV [Pontibacter aydingkolensis]
MEAQSTLQVFVNGDFVPAQQAFLHISDLAIQRGYGVFDFFKADKHKPLFLNDYLERFYNSASLMYLPVPYTKDELRQILQKLISLNNLEESGVKMILTGGYSENGFDPAAPNLIIQQQPLVLPSKEKVKKGISIITHEYLRDLPIVKSINYTTGIRLLHHMREQNAEEVLYFNSGIITEFPRCNFFIVTEDNTLVTPAHNILKGITRKNVMALAAKKYKVVERDITLQEVKQAKETFLTSTTKRILPIVKIDGEVIGTGKPGPITLELLQDLMALEQEVLAETVR